MRNSFTTKKTKMKGMKLKWRWVDRSVFRQRCVPWNWHYGHYGRVKHRVTWWGRMKLGYMVAVDEIDTAYQWTATNIMDCQCVWHTYGRKIGNEHNLNHIEWWQQRWLWHGQNCPWETVWRRRRRRWRVLGLNEDGTNMAHTDMEYWKLQDFVQRYTEPRIWS